MSGGAGGIGSAMVHRFLNDGASVAIVDRDLERAHQLVNQLWTDYADNNQVLQSKALGTLFQRISNAKNVKEQYYLNWMAQLVAN